MSVFTIIKKTVFLGVALNLSVGNIADTAIIKSPSNPTAATTEGRVIGFQDDSGNSVYLGIHYAATTGGNNRYVLQLSSC
jgi:hypothetical protein